MIKIIDGFLEVEELEEMLTEGGYGSYRIAGKVMGGPVKGKGATHKSPYDRLIDDPGPGLA
jgi:hypothetical protein